MFQRFWHSEIRDRKCCLGKKLRNYGRCHFFILLLLLFSLIVKNIINSKEEFLLDDIKKKH